MHHRLQPHASALLPRINHALGRITTWLPLRDETRGEDQGAHRKVFAVSRDHFVANRSQSLEKLVLRELFVVHGCLLLYVMDVARPFIAGFRNETAPPATTPGQSHRLRCPLPAVRHRATRRWH